MIGSLWPLRDDSAARFFDAFYRHLADGKSVGAALNAVRRERIEAGADDASWAGIVLLGDGSYVPFPDGRSGPSSIWTALAGLLVVAATGYFVARFARSREA